MFKAWVDRHDQHLVNLGENLFQYGSRGGRVNRDANTFAESPYVLHRAMQVGVAFPMHQKRIRSGLDEFLNIQIRIRDHEVRFEWQSSDSPYRSYNRSSHGDVGNKMAIHHVDVYPISSGTLGVAYLGAESGEIRGEYRRGDFRAMSIYCRSSVVVGFESEPLQEGKRRKDSFTRHGPSPRRSPQTPGSGGQCRLPRRPE